MVITWDRLLLFFAEQLCVSVSSESFFLRASYRSFIAWNLPEQFQQHRFDSFKFGVSLHLEATSHTHTTVCARGTYVATTASVTQGVFKKQVALLCNARVCRQHTEILCIERVL